MKPTAWQLATKIWITTWQYAVVGIIVSVIFIDTSMSFGGWLWACILALVFSFFGSIPAFVMLGIAGTIGNHVKAKPIIKLQYYVAVVLSICILYAVPLGFLMHEGILRQYHIVAWLVSFLLLAVPSILAIDKHTISLVEFFALSISSNKSILQIIFLINKNNTIMYIESQAQAEQVPLTPTVTNSIFTKAVFTGILILVMLIPTFFISKLVQERQERYATVVQEVSSKWAAAQTISAPFITVPYKKVVLNNDGKAVYENNTLVLLANKVDANSAVFAEPRKRSIYSVLLYKSTTKVNGDFGFNIPASINLADIDFTKANINIAVSDYKGIEEEVKATINGSAVVLNVTPSIVDFGETVLSAPIALSQELLNTGVAFSTQLKLKGSESLHFIAASAAASYSINSAWSNPSFIGNFLPTQRTVKDSGFAATWTFNKANMPFAMAFEASSIKNLRSNTVGVNLIQPVNNYDKTTRSIKYAILIIGLSFGLFFITEVMQKKPLHLVQYLLIGMALVIFYTLLLSLSEYVSFISSYSIAAAATIVLIGVYLHAHFRSVSSTALFVAILSSLYVFVYVLINLEDTALLIGSIGLFIVLSLAMYASRKINWHAK
jgi:inner membrane protein